MLGVGAAFNKHGPAVFSACTCIAFSICMVLLIVYGSTPTTTIMILTVVFGTLALRWLLGGWKFLCGTGIATMILLLLSITTSPMKKARV